VRRNKGWGLQEWRELYTDLPSRQLKVSVADRGAIHTMHAETRVRSPAALQTAIDQCVGACFFALPDAQRRSCELRDSGARKGSRGRFATPADLPIRLSRAVARVEGYTYAATFGIRASFKGHFRSPPVPNPTRCGGEQRAKRGKQPRHLPGWWCRVCGVGGCRCWGVDQLDGSSPSPQEGGASPRCLLEPRLRTLLFRTQAAERRTAMKMGRLVRLGFGTS
jgi:hypothetical protein